MVKDFHPQPFAKLISEVVALRGIAHEKGNSQLAELWREVAGEKIAGQTKSLGIRRGVLRIGVSNSALLSELASFYKQQLLDEIRGRDTEKKIKDLKFLLKGNIDRSDRNNERESQD